MIDLVYFKVVKKPSETGVSPLKVKASRRGFASSGVAGRAARSSLLASRMVIFEKSVYDGIRTETHFACRTVSKYSASSSASRPLTVSLPRTLI